MSEDHLTAKATGARILSVGLFTEKTEKSAGGELLPQMTAPSFEAGDLELKYSHFEQSWNCDFWNNCHSTIQANMFVINKTTGSKIQWNAVETAVKIADGFSPIGDDEAVPTSQYNYYNNVADFYAGAGNNIDGKDPNVWWRVKCWDGAGRWFMWKWFSYTDGQ